MRSACVAVVLSLVGYAVAQTQTLQRGEPVRPLPEPSSMKVDPRKVELGQQLFHDPRLSRDDSIACVSCHMLNREKGGSDGLRVSEGVGGKLGGIRAPTVYNSVFNFRQFWDGRAADLQAQASGPVVNPVEMAADWKDVVKKLDADADFKQRFTAVYPDGISEKNITDAIAEFETTLITPSRFDRYLRGDKNALSDAEKRGYRLFKQYGCTSCHQGVNLGGNMYQKFGIMGDYFANRAVTSSDYGRFNETKRPEDKFVFKVPTLRNVELRAPYFHDASADNLEYAVAIMFQYQLGRNPTAEDVQDLKAFLLSLTGEQFNHAP